MTTRRRLRLPPAYEFAGTLRALTPTGREPSVLLSATELWWAVRTPQGAGTLHLRRVGSTLDAHGYGPGAQWLVEHADAIAGLRDDVSTFEPMAAAHPAVAHAWTRHRGLRMVSTSRPFAVALPAVLGQRVAGTEANASLRRLMHHFGEPAPAGVPGLLLPPDPRTIAETPYWAFHPFGIEEQRANTLRRLAGAAHRLEATTDAQRASALLLAIPGVGPWTTAEVIRVAFGNPDAVSVGDYNLPAAVLYAMRVGNPAEPGEAPGPATAPRPGRTLGPGTPDALMLAELEPFRGHRARVCQLLLATFARPPRQASRARRRNFADY